MRLSTEQFKVVEVHKVTFGNDQDGIGITVPTDCMNFLIRSKNTLTETKRGPSN